MKNEYKGIDTISISITINGELFKISHQFNSYMWKDRYMFDNDKKDFLDYSIEKLKCKLLNSELINNKIKEME